MNVTVYTTNCPQCRALETLLKRNKIEFTKCEDLETMLALGLTSAPNLDVDGNLMNYGEALKWINEVKYEN